MLVIWHQNYQLRQKLENIIVLIFFRRVFLSNDCCLRFECDLPWNVVSKLGKVVSGLRDESITKSDSMVGGVPFLLAFDVS